ncbi:MAG: hypothetical protein J6I96_07445 [Oscillospiraceae bacterium]|nr:hypothetical protein [Oscillospiraceae bacterium]
MIIVQNITAPLGSTAEEIVSLARKRIGRADVRSSNIHKISLDARKHDDIKLNASVCFSLTDSEEQRLAGKDFITYVSNEPFRPVITGDEIPDGRIAVVGFGPAGMFAALVLAEAGYRPIVLERGGDADTRARAVNEYQSGGKLDESSNVQFGEGGAGTFSDGKLTTRIKDPLCRYVSKRLTEFGAPDEIMTRAKPHIGTDNLIGIVKNIRKHIIAHGGEIRFNTAAESIDIKNGRITAIHTKDEVIPVSAAVFAIGHSARDTFEMLLEKNVAMQAKAFAVGARIEHTQKSVNESLYGSTDNPLLPVGEYQLSYTKGRGVYTFCMCPGGQVVASQNENGTIVTNGMSRFARDGKNANSALVVTVGTDDFGNDVLDGVRFAEKIERRAFTLGNGYAPASTVKAFLSGRASLEGASVSPTYLPGVTETDLNLLFPEFISEHLKTGLHIFSRRMKCFADGGAVLTAPETRTSSPVRILRGDDMQSITVKGLFPCGEGAGYAGGIMSAAVDGIKQAQAVMSIYKEAQ